MRTPRGRRFGWKGDADDTSTDHLLELHDGVIRGDLRAAEEIYAALWRPLCGRLRRKFRTTPADLVADAATDAIRAYFENPRAFDPSRQPLLEAYVFGIAERMLRDQIRSAMRRAKHEVDWETARQGYQGQGIDGARSRVLAGQIRAMIPSLCNEREAAAMTAWLETDDPLAVAACLGLSDIPIVAQRRSAWALVAAVVKRFKRRLLKEAGANSVPRKFAGRRRKVPFGG